MSASYGGRIALLIRAEAGGTVNYTVLQVEEGQEQPQADAFIKAHAPNGRTIARFASRDGPLARAFELCPGAFLRRGPLRHRRGPDGWAEQCPDGGASSGSRRINSA